MQLRFMSVMMLFASGLLAQTAFNASGTFADGTTLGGTVTINTATGQVTSVDLTLSAPNAATLTLIADVGSVPGSVVISAGTPSVYPQVSLWFPVSTLAGYSGGALCSNTSPCTSGAFTNLARSDVAGEDRLTSGSLTPASQPPGTPAPPSLWLALVGCATVLAYALRARRRNYA